MNMHDENVRRSVAEILSELEGVRQGRGPGLDKIVDQIDRTVSSIKADSPRAAEVLSAVASALKPVSSESAEAVAPLISAAHKTLEVLARWLESDGDELLLAGVEEAVCKVGLAREELQGGSRQGDAVVETSAPSADESAVDDFGDMGDMVKEFLVESYENLDQLDRDLITLEQDPTSKETLASVFRTIHTIKGTCGWFGFSKLESVTHIGENLLSKLRDGRMKLSQEITSGLLAMVDAVRQILSSIEAERNEGDVDYSSLIAILTALNVEAPSEISNDSTRAETPDSAANPSGNIGDLLVKSGQATADDIAAAIMQQEQGDPRHLGEILVEHGVVQSKAVVDVLTTQGVNDERTGDPRHMGEILLEQGKVKPQDVVEVLRIQGEPRQSSVSDNNIRVDVGLLDKLMNLVGELVLARNQIMQYTTTQEDAAFVATSQHLNLITTELQEGVMKTRMQPIGNIWSKFPRVVRDLSINCGKNIRIEMEGKETELDKTIIEAIKDPLTHLVRNSVDHGIETPDVRRAKGKAAEGNLFLRAFHEGGQVNIEISDDGAGINLEVVKEKALQKGLVTAEQAARMSDREAVNLIFLPGFSTAQKVTNISGRGVGMDVVKTNIEKIGGMIEINNRPNHGTTIKIKIPLTLAIIPALIVTSGGDRYAIPQVSLLELVRLEGDEARARIEMIYGTPVYRLRGNLLPLVYLNHELKVEAQASTETGESLNNSIQIVVLRANDRQFGLVVDEINDTEEIVVKPLGKQLKGISSFAGATIMGDGRVALILDVLGIAQRANLVAEARERGIGDMTAKSQERSADIQTLLLFGLGDDGRLAIPLSMVARLEEFPITTIERAGGQEVVQYRGQIIPLIRLSNVLGHLSTQVAAVCDPMQVVVYTHENRSVGLVIDRIIDIVEESLVVQNCANRVGVLGSAVIQQRVTDLLDVHGIIESVNPNFFQRSVAAEARV